ncbi:MAG: histidine kinase [Crocinitomicaceae bacterium]|nr:histidine kinase [Crocinitomicaceae bacterium]
MELVLYSVGFSVFLACLLVIATIYSKKTIVKTELAKKQLEIDHQKELVEQLIEVQEEERSRIARELHDGVNAKLATVLLFVAQPTEKIDQTSISNSIKEAMQISRRISYDLLPPTLESFGLKGALFELFEEIQEKSDILIKIELDNRVDDIPPNKQLHVYRIIQESLQNTIKYAEASSIELTAVFDEKLHITYRDNGKGMNFETTPQLGLGLKNIVARSEMIPALHEFNSELGKGFQTKLTIEL